MKDCQPGDHAQQYLKSLEGFKHPLTDRLPIIGVELQKALERGFFAKADEMTHNYLFHGRVEAGVTCSPSCFERDVSVDLYSAS